PFSLCHSRAKRRIPESFLRSFSLTFSLPLSLVFLFGLFLVSFRAAAAKNPGLFSLAFSLCHSEPPRRRIPESFLWSFSLAFSLCHSEPLRRRIPVLCSIAADYADHTGVVAFAARCFSHAASGAGILRSADSAQE